MQVWKRRFAVLVAVGAGSAGLMMSTAGAQTSPPDIPDFTIPSLPDFTFPTFTIPPPPTMPPSIPTSSTPPPTMPPVPSPSTSVPFPDIEEVLEDLIDRLENFIEEGEAGYEQFQELLDQLRSSFLD